MLELLQVTSGAERAIPGAADDEHLDVPVADPGQRFVELAHGLRRERVACLRAIDRDRRHRTFDCQSEVTHAGTLAALRSGASSGTFQARLGHLAEVEHLVQDGIRDSLFTR